MNVGIIGMGLFFTGLGLSLLSVCIQNEVGGFQYSINPKVGGMLLDTIGIAIMALGAVLLGIIISKKANIK